MLNQNILMFTFKRCAVIDLLSNKIPQTWQKYSTFVCFNTGEYAAGPIKIRSLHEKLFRKNKPEAAWNYVCSALKCHMVSPPW